MNYGVAAVETGGKQMSAGHLRLDRFESLTATNKNSRYPVGYLLFLAEDEGFEPPQTESESGVLPLHKSSKRNVIIIRIFSEKSRGFGNISIFLPRERVCPSKSPADRQR